MKAVRGAFGAAHAFPCPRTLASLGERNGRDWAGDVIRNVDFNIADERYLSLIRREVQKAG